MTPSNTRKPPVKAADTRKPMAKAAARPSTTKPRAKPPAQLALDLPAPAEHPSRSQPLCADCEHAAYSWWGNDAISIDTCQAPASPRCPVTGRNELSPKDARRRLDNCGPQAVWFVPRSEPIPRRKPAITPAE